MDKNVESAIRNEMGESRLHLIERMLDIMESNQSTDAKDKIRKLIERQADEEGVQAEEHRAL